MSWETSGLGRKRVEALADAFRKPFEAAAGEVRPSDRTRKKRIADERDSVILVPESDASGGMSGRVEHFPPASRQVEFIAVSKHPIAFGRGHRHSRRGTQVEHGIEQPLLLILMYPNGDFRKCFAERANTRNMVEMGVREHQSNGLESSIPNDFCKTGAAKTGVHDETIRRTFLRDDVTVCLEWAEGHSFDFESGTNAHA